MRATTSGARRLCTEWYWPPRSRLSSGRQPRSRQGANRSVSSTRALIPRVPSCARQFFDFLHGPSPLPEAEVGPAVGDEDQEKGVPGMPGLLLAQQFPGQEEGMGQGGLAAGGQVRQIALGHLDAMGKGQGHPGLAAPEDDEPHPLPLLVGVDQERQDRGLGLGHALVRPHGAGGVHHEQDVPPDALLPHLVAQVRLTDGQGQVAALPQPLVRGRGP